jgi:hypothetical protein
MRRPLAQLIDRRSKTLCRSVTLPVGLFAQTVQQFVERFGGKTDPYSTSDLAAAAGCSVAGGVTTHTTLLVVGDQDIRKLAGHEKSSKHRKAEELIRKGQSIRILGESDFQKIVKI